MENTAENTTKSEAKGAKFLVVDSDPSCKESNRWFKHCRSESIPYVLVRTNSGTATVEWDYITFPNELDHVLDQNEVELVKGLRALRTKYGTKRSELWGGNRLALFRNIPIDQAEGLAEDLFDLVEGVVGLRH